ncbi:MAG: DUF1826 domain-containing protein [Bacteroidota bacterium]
MKRTTVKNWAEGDSPVILEDIHRKEVNIAIYNRDTTSLTNEVNQVLEMGVTVKLSGEIDAILHGVAQSIEPRAFPHLTQDIKGLLQHFQQVTGVTSLRLLLATVNTNMCRRFHTDANDVRMLCTYSGPGTLWLPEDNVNREVLASPAGNDSIVLDEDRIQQAATGSVLLLKGAVYPQEGVQAIVHRSPTLEESGEKRLLLRVDTNQFLSFMA